MKSEKRSNIALIEQLQSTITILRGEVKELKSDDEIDLLKQTIEELKTDQVKLVSDLESCKSTDADLIISQQETKECNEELEGEANKNFPCEFDKNVKFRHLQITRRIKIVIFSQPEARL